MSRILISRSFSISGNLSHKPRAPWVGPFFPKGTKAEPHPKSYVSRPEYMKEN